MTPAGTATARPDHQAGWPAPGRGGRPFGHLPGWGRDPLALLEDGAGLAPVFELRLWRRTLVGYRPDWNRLVLGDLDVFRSAGSLSQLSPYLRGGVVALDAPEHRARRAQLNPPFHRRSIAETFSDRFRDLVARSLPTGVFEAGHWASRMVRRLLADAFFGSRLPAVVLRSFLAPLDRGFPAPLLPRPVRIRRMNAALRTALDDPETDTLAAVFAALPDGVEEARVALAAGYDTTAHTLAFALWELADRPDLNETASTRAVVREALRMYPSGWIGSRVTARPVEFGGRRIPAGRLVLYSPYLSHRDPDLWVQPRSFRPDRFDQPIPAWGYLPFAAGERSCLGAALATAMLEAVVGGFADSRLIRIDGDPRPSAAVTLTARGRMVLRRDAT